jgi:hypothetical protein
MSPWVHPVESTDPVLHALLRKRVEIYTWLESPVKQAHLAKINHMIEEHRDSLNHAAIEISGATPSGAQSPPPQFASSPTASLSAGRRLE